MRLEQPNDIGDKAVIGDWGKKLIVKAIYAYPELRKIENPSPNLLALIQLLGTLPTVGGVGDTTITYKELLDRQNTVTVRTAKDALHIETSQCTLQPGYRNFEFSSSHQNRQSTVEKDG